MFLYFFRITLFFVAVFTTKSVFSQNPFKSLEKHHNYVESYQPLKKSAKRIKIPIILEHYESFRTEGVQGHKKNRFIISKKTKRIFVAKLTKNSHFFVDGYHFITEPFYQADEQKMRLKLSVIRRFGKTKKIEESLGVLKFSSKLGVVKGTLFLQEQTSRLIKDKMGVPIIKIYLGGYQKAKLQHFSQRK